jgi:hypothetical protein
MEVIVGQGFIRAFLESDLWPRGLFYQVNWSEVVAID